MPANYSELATLSASPPSFSLQLVPPADRKKKNSSQSPTLQEGQTGTRRTPRPLLIPPEQSSREAFSLSLCSRSPRQRPRSRGRKRSPGTSPLPDRDAPAARRRLAYVCIGLLMTSLDGSENSSIKMDAFGRDYHRRRVIASYLTALFFVGF